MSEVIGAIDPKISPEHINDQNKILILEHGLHVTLEGDRFVVTDPQIEGKHSKRKGGNLTVLVGDALDFRAEYLKKNPPPSDKKEKKVRQPKKETSTEPKKIGKLIAMKTLIFQHPTAKPAEINKMMLEQYGFESTEGVIQVCRSDMFHTIRFLLEQKEFSEVVLPGDVNNAVYR